METWKQSRRDFGSCHTQDGFHDDVLAVQLRTNHFLTRILILILKIQCRTHHSGTVPRISIGPPRTRLRTRKRNSDRFTRHREALNGRNGDLDHF